MSTLDVEALLPAALNEEGLTGTVLEQLAYNIDQQTAKVRQNIMLLCQRYYSQPAPKADAQIETALEYLASYSQSDVLRELAGTAREFREKQQLIHNLNLQLHTAKAAAELDTQTKDIDAHLQAGEYTDAAYNVLQLQKMVQDEGEGSSADFDHLKSAWLACSDKLEQALAAGVAQLVSFDQQQLQLQLRSSFPTGSDSSHLWSAMELAGSSSQHLQGLADALLQQLLPPLLSSTHQLHVSTSASHAAATVQLLPLQQQQQQQQPEAAIKELLELLSSCLFSSSQQPAAVLGSMLWSKLAAAYQQHRLQPLAAAALGPEHLQGVLAAAKELETAAAALGYTANVAEPRALSRGISGLIRQSQRAVQAAHLQAARAALMGYAGGQYDSVAVGQPLVLDVELYRRVKSGSLQEWEAKDPPCGLDTAQCPPLAKGCYKISAPAAELEGVLRRVVSEAAASGSRATAQALCSAVAYVCTLLRHLPGQLAPQVLQLPQLAFTYHNDLQHTADLLLLLPFAHAQQLQQLLGAGQPSFLEEAALLRAAAADVLQQQLQQQEQQFVEVLGQLAGLGAVKAGQKGLQQRKVVQQVLHSLGRLGRMMQDVLAPADAARVAGAVLHSIGSALSADILARRDIGVEDCKEILAVLKPVLEEGLQRAVPPPAAAAEGAGQAEALTYCMRQEALGAAGGFRRLKVVLRMLDAKMFEIVEKWEGGVLQKAGLALAEVEQLLCALFEDTQIRREALRRVGAAAGGA